MFFQGLANEVIARTGVTYLAESVVGILLAIAFFHFSQLYDRHYLKTWALSWTAFSIGSLSLGFATLYGLSRTDNVRLVTALLSQAGYLLHVLFLLTGTYELVQSKKIHSRRLLTFCGVVIVVSFISVLLYHNNPDPHTIQYRYLLRVLLRHLIVSLCFLIAGFVTFKNPVFTRSFGQRTMVFSFFAYGLIYLYYFILGVLSFMGQRIAFPFFFGMIELVMISVMGTSMVMWLLEDEREKLSKTNRELDNFFYSTSHDLRAPIASILGLTNLARHEIPDKKSTEFMLMIEERIKKLDTVIADILTLSRSKKAEIKIEPVDFNLLLKDVLNDIHFNDEASAISLNYKESTLNVFRTDYNQMKIILSNLITNAVKYHNFDQPHPIIKVSYQRMGRSVEITVEDNGIGIPNESISKIFDMFYRATLASEGTGLGLYIVKEALTKINATIDVRSELGKGTNFKVTLANA